MIAALVLALIAFIAPRPILKLFGGLLLVWIAGAIMH